ncbi:MAG: glycosyltransferase, partial [Solirubrobacterales bacterium]
VVLFFGLIRPNKGLDLLVEAMAQVPEAELWIVGKSKLSDGELRDLTARAAALPGGSRLVIRYVEEGEVRSVMERADLLVLPYRSRDESGVLHVGLAFGKAMVVSDLGGPGELAGRTDAVVAVPPEDPAALALAIRDLVEHPDNREELERRAAALAETELSWDRVAEQTIGVYEEAIAEVRR